MVKITRRGAKAWVTFTLSEAVGPVRLKGSWNGWVAEPMRPKKGGGFYLTRVLSCGGEYEFGYETGDGRWVCDETLPRTDSPFGSKNSVLRL